MIASVLIKANDQLEYLCRTFIALSQQTVQDFEVLFLYSGDSPDTLVLATRWGARIVQISPKQFSHPRVLNLGAQLATGEYLVSLSADAVPTHQEWLQQLIAPFVCSSVAGVYGRHLLRQGGNLLDRVRIRSRYGLSSRCKWLDDDHIFSNANSAIRRALWEERHFDETLPGCEDYEWASWALRRGFAIAYAPEAAVFHTHGETYGYLPYVRRIIKFKVLLRVIDKRTSWSDMPSVRHRPCALVHDPKEVSTCPWLTDDCSATSRFS